MIIDRFIFDSRVIHRLFEREKIMAPKNIDADSQVLIATTDSECSDPSSGQFLEEYALGHLSTSDEEKFESHLAECRRCQVDLMNIDAVTHALKSTGGLGTP